MDNPFKNRHIHFVTGKLAAPFLEKLLEDLSEKYEFDYSFQVLKITVAALMTPKWVAPKLKIPDASSLLVLPGYCEGDLTPITETIEIEVIRGPKDFRDLPRLFGGKDRASQIDQWSIEIIAEINHAPRIPLPEFIKLAQGLVSDGADIIDVGCEPHGAWGNVGSYVRALKTLGMRVSIDSLNPDEIKPAVAAGAELVLSVNSSNREFAADWGCEVVAIPDEISDIDSINETIEYLGQRNVPFRIDPILEPIGLGFAASLERYMTVRRHWPGEKMMMGIGNITELTDADSAGINLMLLGICQELKIGSVLTTQVINWSRSSVKECEIGRRLVFESIASQTPPKNLSSQLVTLRDTRLHEFSETEISELADRIKDNNYRIFASGDELHLVGAKLHFHDSDPFSIFAQLAELDPRNLDQSHSFYLGYEMCKAAIANLLGKNYTQDESLNWGYLTEEKTTCHRLNKVRVRNDHENSG